MYNHNECECETTHSELVYLKPCVNTISLRSHIQKFFALEINVEQTDRWKNSKFDWTCDKTILKYSKNLKGKHTYTVRKLNVTCTEHAYQTIRTRIGQPAGKSEAIPVDKQQNAIKDTINYTAAAHLSQAERTVDRSGEKSGPQISYLYPPSTEVCLHTTPGPKCIRLG